MNLKQLINMSDKFNLFNNFIMLDLRKFDNSYSLNIKLVDDVIN